MLLTSIALCLTVLVSVYIFFDSTREYNAVESALFGTFDRVFWSIGTVGIMFVAIYGSLPIVSKMLSWKLWIPFSKLSFASYIVHANYHIRSVAVATSPIDYNLTDLVRIYTAIRKVSLNPFFLDNSRIKRLRICICSCANMLPSCRSTFWYYI